MSKRRYWPVILLYVYTLSACNFMPSTVSVSEENPEQTPTAVEETDAELVDIDYADARAEANFAIQKQDFHLLALNQKTLSVPGVDLNNFDLAELEQQCGIKILADSGDEITEDDELALRKKLFAYAAQYNQLVLLACRDKQTSL